jgi:hypothetical protein
MFLHPAMVPCATDKRRVLDRFIYRGESLRENMCPIHKGHWSGCNITGENPCECAHDTCITGWLQNPRDPKSEASFQGDAAEQFLKGQEELTAANCRVIPHQI